MKLFRITDGLLNGSRPMMQHDSWVFAESKEEVEELCERLKADNDAGNQNSPMFMPYFFDIEPMDGDDLIISVLKDGNLVRYPLGDAILENI